MPVETSKRFDAAVKVALEERGTRHNRPGAVDHDLAVEHIGALSARLVAAATGTLLCDQRGRAAERARLLVDGDAARELREAVLQLDASHRQRNGFLLCDLDDQRCQLRSIRDRCTLALGDRAGAAKPWGDDV